jgi:methylmalonyl-CoA mutase N-terminal domain/subunit
VTGASRGTRMGLYGPDDFPLDALRRNERPGHPPFTRGISERMYLEQPWIMGQYAGFGSASDTNARFKRLLDQGQTGFSVALDLPTQLGLDSDHPLARGEVGRVGVAIDSLEDMKILFDGIPLDQIRQIRTTANSIGHIWLALVVALAEERRFDPNGVKILIQNDVLKEYIARGTQIYPPREGLRVAVDVIEYCARHLTSWTPLSMSGYHIREAGATVVQELAFTFANGVEYCKSALSRGLLIDDFAGSLFSFLAADLNFLEEVAKFRAARRVWDRIMSDRFQAQSLGSRALRIFAFSSGSRLTYQQPLVNIARVTISALAAVLGGVQTLHTSAYDEARGVPSEEAAMLALRIQQVILEETDLARAIDPLGGSWAIEALTSQIEDEVVDELERIEHRGGALACIESGWFRAKIADEAYRAQCDIDSGARHVVGVNAHRLNREPHPLQGFALDASIEAEQITRLQVVRRGRDSGRVLSARRRLEEAARDGASVVAPTIEAIRAYATVGEVSETLARVFGRYAPDAAV